MNRTNFVRASLAATMMAALALSDAGRATYASTDISAVVAQVGEVTVITDTLNVRSGPSTADPIIGKLTCGQKVQPNGKTADGSWWRIPYANGNGFIFAQFATQGGTCGNPAAAAPAAAAAPVAAAATTGGGVSVSVTTATLNVRSGPGTNYSILGRLSQGQTVTANGKTANGQWLQIDFNGTKAYIFAAYTTFSTGAAPAQAAAPAAAAPAAAAPAPAKSAGGFELGAHINGLERADALKDTGMNWVKVQQFVGNDVTGLVTEMHNAGLKVLIGALGDRGRVADTGYHAEYAAWVADVARKGADAIEIWNEPNLDREFGGGGNNKVNPETYVNLLRVSHAAIKAANPNTLVVSGAPAPTGAAGGNCRGDICDDKPFLERVAAAGGTAYMDCQGAHFNGSPNAPDVRNGGPTGDHYSWYFWGTFDTTFNALGGRVPICFTEMGYATKDGIAGSMPGNFSWANNITLSNQSEWSGRLVTLLRTSGRARLAIFWNWNFRTWIPGDGGDPQSGYSLLRPDGSCPTCSSIKSAMGR